MPKPTEQNKEGKSRRESAEEALRATGDFISSLSAGAPTAMPGMPGAVVPPPALPGIKLPAPGVGVRRALPPAMIPPAPTPGPAQHPAYRSGFEFQTKGGRDAAIVTNTIQSFSNLAAKMKKQKREKRIREAQSLFEQWAKAAQAGDEAGMRMIEENPKFQKAVDNALVPVTKAPDEIPDESVALKRTMETLKQQNRIGGGGVIRPPFARGAQTEAYAESAAQQAAERDPERLAQMQLGELTSGEARTAARIGAGIEVPAEVKAQLGEGRWRFIKQAEADFYKFMASEQRINQRFYDQLEQQPKLMKMRLDAMKDIAKARHALQEKAIEASASRSGKSIADFQEAGGKMLIALSKGNRDAAALAIKMAEADILDDDTAEQYFNAYTAEADRTGQMAEAYAKDVADAPILEMMRQLLLTPETEQEKALRTRPRQ